MAYALLVTAGKRDTGVQQGGKTFMDGELLFSEHFLWDGKCYLVRVYRRPLSKERGSHMAETTLGPGDSVISDGRSPEEVLHKQQTILPLAILSRALL